MARKDNNPAAATVQAVRRSKAFSLRKAGVSYADIGSALSVSASTAFNDVKTVLQLVNAKTLDAAAELRSMEAARFPC